MTATANKTIHDYPTITSLTASDELIVWNVSGATTNKTTIDSIVALVSAGSVSVTASAVSAAGAVMYTQFGGNTGYAKVASASTVTAVTTIPASNISGLAAVATTGTLDSLTDVSTTSAAASTYLMNNGTQWVAVSITAGAGGSLATLSDVSLGTLSNNQVLTYDSSSSKWVNSSPTSVTIDASAISAVGGILETQFSGLGYVKKTGTQAFTEVCTIPSTDITGLGTLATTSTAASAQSFIGFTSIGTAITINASTAASARSALGLGSLATQNTITISQISDAGSAGATVVAASTAVSIRSILGFTAYGATLVSAADATTARGLLGYLNSGTTDNTLVRFDGTAGLLQGSQVIVEDAGSIYGYQGKLNAQTSVSSYTLVSADCGKVLTVNITTTCSITLPNSMPAGFNCSFVQAVSLGVYEFKAATSTTIIQRQGYTKTAGQGAAVGLLVIENSNGTAAKYVLSGDMA